MGFLASSLDERLIAFVGRPARPPTWPAYLEASEGLDAYVRNDFVEAALRSRLAFDIDSTFPAPLVIASISLSNLGRFAAADSVLDILEQTRSRLSPHQLRWVEYRRALMAGHHEAVYARCGSSRGRAGVQGGLQPCAAGAAGGTPGGSPGCAAIAPTRGGPMLGFVSYWDLLSTIQHLLGERDDELATGRDAQAANPTRIFALLPSLRALAALGRTADIDSLLRQAGRLPADPAASEVTLLGDIAEELRAHGHQEPAARY